MKNRIIIDFTLGEALSGEEAEELKNDIKDFIENYEFTYYATHISVKYQDEYCLEFDKQYRNSKEDRL